MPELPRLARLAIRLGTRPAWREELLGDLEEILEAELEAGVPPRQARRAVLREALASSLPAVHRGYDPRLAHSDSYTAAASAKATGRQLAPERGDPLLTAFLIDLRFALRRLFRAPGFTAVAILTLALGIGCVTAFWSLFDAVLLRPLPFAEPERLVQLWGENVESPGGRYNSSYPDFVDIRDGTSAFAKAAVYQPTFANLVEDGTAPERVPTTFISDTFFDALGLSPAHGRDLGPDDDRKGAEPVVLLGYTLWQERFGGDPEVLGRVLKVDGVARTVVGVAPAGNHFPRPTDLWVPVNALSGTEVRGVHNLRVVGRLASGVELARAREEVSAVAARLRDEYPRSNAQLGARLDPLLESLVGQTRPQLWLVASAALVLLLVVIANISSLLLERATRRQRELATRAALGASHGQLLRSFLAESTVVVTVGAAGGLGVAHLARGLLLDFGPALPRAVDPGLDGRVLGFAAGITAVLGLLFALIPSFHVLGRNLVQRLGAAAVGATGQSSARWRSAFVVAQVALAVMLTLGAALLVQSLKRLYSVDLGFRAEGVLTADLELSTPYVSDEWPATVAFYEELIERLESAPGVVSAAAAHQHPASPGWGTSFTIAGQPEPEEGLEPEAIFRPVTDRYFETAGIPLLRGRGFDASVRSEPPGQMVVNEAFVSTHLGGGPALGQRIVRNSWWIRDIQEYEIIGVVADTRFAGRHRPPQPAMYLPHRQDVPPAMTVVVRAEEGLDPLSLAPTLRAAVAALEPEMPVGRISTLEERVADTVSQRSFLTWLLTAFAITTLVLAALGLYGSLAYATARRTRELGLRMAIGARSGQLLTMVLGQGLRLAAVGLVLGLGGSWLGSRGLEAMLFGVERGDPATYVAVATLLALVALAAGWLPAWRATRIDPCRALAED
ncbi:MAG: ABC transporter permease [Holophagales bacterium]|nr:ABC transporter permease [Holophagales bacterium]